MKTLPESPSLEHLRQQAKDVLPHLRAVRNQATLSDAQSHIAHQYGFRTWPELKAEVDRRRASAVAPASSDDTAAELAAAFGPSGGAARPPDPAVGGPREDALDRPRNVDGPAGCSDRSTRPTWRPTLLSTEAPPVLFVTVTSAS